MTKHTELFAAALQIAEPLYVQRIAFDQEQGELHIHIDFRRGAKFPCPKCEQAGLPVHDTEEKQWRHLNFFQYRAYIHFRTPRVRCSEHGVHQITVPWAGKGSGFTLLFEALVMELAAYMAVKEIATIVEEHDTRIWRIIQRYVQAGRAEADYSAIASVGVDETSSKKRHTYVTVFTDMQESRVVHVEPGKDAQTVHAFKQMLVERAIDPHQISHICADMSPAFRRGVAEAFPDAEITFDKFHVMKLMNEALDAVRKAEQKNQALLKHSRYLWLYNPKRLNKKQTDSLESLKKLNLKTARAYRIKLSLQEVYQETNKAAAEQLLKQWYSWAVRCRLEPVKEFAKTVKINWKGILNYFDSLLTNGILESINSLVQAARRRARGYRNVNNFITMIFLLSGKLNLGVDLRGLTHTI